MDLFSHGLFGFVLGRALLLDTNTQIILVISSVILDIDAIRTRRSTWFQFHRGPLHSFAFAIFISLLISTIYTALMSLPARAFISIALICLGGSFSHILLDLFTPRSIAVLWPFSEKKIAFDLTYFFDPIFLGVVLLASVLIISAKNSAEMIQAITLISIVLLTVNLVVRYHERGSASETVKGLDVGADRKVVLLPTLRPDRWWVAEKTSSKNGYRYEIYSVDSISKRILSHSTVTSPFIDYREPAEPPIDSPEKAVAYSKRDKRVRTFIEQSRLPAVNVNRSDDGRTWQVFWYDVYTQLSEGISRGVNVKVEIG